MKYRQRREDVIEVISTGKVMLEYMDIEIQKAFMRGRGITEASGERDQVQLAIESGITDPKTLANIYSREQGFKP